MFEDVAKFRRFRNTVTVQNCINVILKYIALIRGMLATLQFRDHLSPFLSRNKSKEKYLLDPLFCMGAKLGPSLVQTEGV
jgi:hypothetical protein